MESTDSEAEEDVKEEGLRRLFLSSSSSCEDDSELEWRKAVRAALEADIQYQVRLRLALDYTEPHEETPSDHNEPDEEQQLLDLHQKRRRLKTSRNLEKVKKGGEENKVKLPNSGHSLVLSSLHLASTNSKQREPFSLYISNTTRYTLRQLKL